MSLRQEPYAGPRTVGLVRTALTVLGVAAAVAGPAYAVNGATQAPASVRVPVEVPSGAPDAGSLRGPGSTVPEQLLSRGDDALVGLAVGLGVLLVHPLFGAVAAGRPFAVDAARRLAALVVVVLVVGYLGPLLPRAATGLVLERLALGPGSGLVVPGYVFPLDPLLVAGVVLVLAEVFRQGERTARDVDGLV